MKNKKITVNAAKLIKHMKESELKHYSIDLTPIDGMTDHELLVNLTKRVDSDHELLIELVKEFKEFKTEFKEFKKYVIQRFDNLVAKNNLKE